MVPVFHSPPPLQLAWADFLLDADVDEEVDREVDKEVDKEVDEEVVWGRFPVESQRGLLAESSPTRPLVIKL